MIIHEFGKIIIFCPCLAVRLQGAEIICGIGICEPVGKGRGNRGVSTAVYLGNSGRRHGGDPCLFLFCAGWEEQV